MPEAARQVPKHMNKKFVHLSNKVARKVQKAVDVWARSYWHTFPFGSEPRATKDQYLELWTQEKSRSYPEIDSFEQEKGMSIDLDWFHNLALHTQIVIKDSNLCYQHGRVLYSTLRDYLASTKDKWDNGDLPASARSITILETGTARGFSSIVMAKALCDEAVFGKIMTFDLLPHTQKMYWNCIDDLEGTKTRQELLLPWKDLVDPFITFMEIDSRIGLSRTAMGRINFAFLDGAHTYDDVMIEFDMVQKRQEAGDVIVFDDYNMALFPGIVEAVDEGCKTWGYEQTILRSRDQRAYVIARKKG